MKAALLLPFVLLLGLAIGGWAPREELRACRQEVDDLRKKQADREQNDRTDIFTRMVKIPSRASRPAASPPRMAPPEDRRPVPGDSEAESASNAAARVSGRLGHPHQKPPKPEDLRARIDEAKELWKTRVEIARAQWIDRLKLTADGTALFDDSINAMNERLYNAMQDLADQLAATDTLTPEDGLRAANEMTDVLVQTYDDLNAIVPEEFQGEVATTELTDFIDPAVAEPLVAVQDKLANLPRPQGQRTGLLK